ncbi:MAG: alpha/beta hydrolase [SAR324 cluster bacterium]|nr:alpha/beta hydrolase [SAR324 cluster bacterium]
MAILFLLWSMVCAVLTFNVFRPLRLIKDGKFYFATFVFGWLIGDLVFHWIVFNLGIALLFYLAGALESDIGQIALMLSFSSWVILGFRAKMHYRMGPLIQNQMNAALGADYKSKILPEFRQKFIPFAFDWKAYWNPAVLSKNPQIEIISDIVFFEERGCRLLLDIYRPRNHSNACPVLLQVHGGGWTIGTKNQGIPLMTRMASQGWICFAISYRLSPQAIFPDHVIDCKRAVAWIKEHGIKYGADPDFIIITGGSSGAHLSALTALTPNQADLQPQFETVDTTIQGCVAFYGIYDFEAPFQIPRNKELAGLLKTVMRSTPETEPKKFRQASPVRRISRNPPPFMILQGDSDALVPMREARNFYQALQKANTPRLVFLHLPMVKHSFDTLPTIPTQQILPYVEQYLSLLRSDYAQKNFPAEKS